MMVSFQKAPVRSILRKVEEPVVIESQETYKQVTVRLFHRGVVLRARQTGADIRTARQWKVRSGQIILSRIDARNGAIGLVPLDLDGAVVTNDFWAFEVNTEVADPRFLDSCFGTEHFVDACRRASEGTTNRVRLQLERFLDIEVPMPSLAEQRRIVARIDELTAKIDEARGLKGEAAEKSHNIMRAIVSSMDVELRGSNETASLEELASHEKGAIRSGPFGSSLLHGEFVDEGVLAIGIEDVQENRFALSRRWHVTPQKAAELERFRIRPGDILITVMGTLGRTCVVPQDIPHMISTKHVWTLTLDPNLAFGPWVSCWLNFSMEVRRELLGQTTGTAIGGLNGKKIRAITLPLIPLQEQRRIVADLDQLQASVDSVKRLQAETAAELDAFQPSILDKAFKGEL